MDTILQYLTLCEAKGSSERPKICHLYYETLVAVLAYELFFLFQENTAEDGATTLGIDDFVLKAFYGQER